MGFSLSSNFREVMDSIKKKQPDPGKLKKTANQIRQVGVQSIQSNLYPGHGFDTGNLSKSYERCSKVEVSNFVATVTWTSDVDYQKAQEAKSPHLNVGIHQVLPEITELAKNWDK